MRHASRTSRGRKRGGWAGRRHPASASRGRPAGGLPRNEIMSRRAEVLPVSFTAQERELIRHEMGIHFSQYPRLADGIFLRTWRGGPQKNQPKIPPAVRTMLD